MVRFLQPFEPMHANRIARLRSVRFALAAGVIATGLLATPGTAAAAGEEQDADFAFGWPRWSIALRGLQNLARAEGDFYEFVQMHLFAPGNPGEDPKDPESGRFSFNGPGVAFDVGYAITPRLDYRVGMHYLHMFQPSELRHFEGSDNLPIYQDTTLSQTELSTSLTLALLPRGRAIGTYVWIPGRVVPYVGVGVGLIRYGLIQEGEFVDANDGALFSATIESQGWTGSTHFIAGADVRLTPRTSATVEIIYAQAAADLGDAFPEFEPMDLAGVRIEAGIRFAF